MINPHRPEIICPRRVDPSEGSVPCLSSPSRLPPRPLLSPSPLARKSRLLPPLKLLKKLLKPLSKPLTKLLTLQAMLLLLLSTLLAPLLTLLLLRPIRLLLRPRRTRLLLRPRRPRLRPSTKHSCSSEHGRGGQSAALFVCADVRRLRDPLRRASRDSGSSPRRRPRR